MNLPLSYKRNVMMNDALNRVSPHIRVVRSESDLPHLLRVMRSQADRDLDEDGGNLDHVRVLRSEEPGHQRIMRSQAPDSWGHHVRVIKSLSQNDNDLVEVE